VSGSLRAGVTFPSSSPLEGEPLDSLGFPAGVRASEAGVFGNAAHRSHSSRPPSEDFSRPSNRSPASTRCERTAAREDGSSDSKVDPSRRQEKHHRGKRPRVVISSGEPQGEPHESEERLQSSEREASPRVSSLQSEGVLDRGDPGLSRGWVRESVLVGCERKPSKQREGRSKPTTGTRGGT